MYAVAPVEPAALACLRKESRCCVPCSTSRWTRSHP